MSGIYHYNAPQKFPNLPFCLIGVLAQDNFPTKGIEFDRFELKAMKKAPGCEEMRIIRRNTDTIR